MSDLIRRQDVLAYQIRADHYDREHGNKHFIAGIESVMEYVECLPSAEPKTPSNGSITSVKPENMHDRTMGDLISRQEAKDAIDMALDHIDHVPPWVYDKLLNVLNEVPSAEKTQLLEEGTTKDATSELISRQDAIEALEQIRYALWEIDIPSPTVPEYIEHHRDVQNVMKRIDEIRDKMERLPSAEPEIIRCKDCEYFSMTTLGMPYACWKGADKIFGETGEHANHTVCRRIDSPDWFCADGERRSE